MSRPDLIVLYNPHVDDFLGEPLHFRLLGRRALKKYGFLLGALMDEQGCVPVVVDGTVSASIPPAYFNRLPAFARRLVSEVELWLWRRWNPIPGLIRYGASDQANSRRTLMVFSYKGAGRHPDQHAIFAGFHQVVFHLSHYFVNTEEKAVFLRGVGNAWLAGDSDVSSNLYFKKFFPWYRRQFLTLPFAVADRFEVRKRLSERQPRCIATGSVHDLRLEVPASAYRAYMEATGLHTYHPLRAALYAQKDSIADIIEVRVSPYRDYGDARSAWKRAWNHFSVKQQAHFAYDIVDLYNDYTFAVVGEEASGFPALGMFEAMACGCVVLADPKALDGLGLVSGTHYLAHDGTSAGLLSELAVDRASSQLGTLSHAGAHYVKHQFSAAVVGQRWMRTLRSVGISTDPSHKYVTE